MAPFYRQESEAQRDWVTCLESRSLWEEEPGFEPTSALPRSCPRGSHCKLFATFPSTAACERTFMLQPIFSTWRTWAIPLLPLKSTLWGPGPLCWDEQAESVPAELLPKCRFRSPIDESRSKSLSFGLVVDTEVGASATSYFVVPGGTHIPDSSLPGLSCLVRYHYFALLREFKTSLPSHMVKCYWNFAWSCSDL